RATRPRVAPTVKPTPTPEIIDEQVRDEPREGRQAPVLQGVPQGRQPGTVLNSQGIEEEEEVVKVETNLVTMPVSVLDRDGRFVSGLRQQDFTIFENGVAHQVEFFQSVEQPFTVVLMIDVSPSTAYQINEIHDAAIAFVRQLRPNDRVMVIAFDEDVRVLTQPTNDRYRLEDAIRQAQFGNGTSIYSAVDQVLNRELAMIQGRKAIVMFTDGVDTTSTRATVESTIKDAEETDVLIYPIRYNTQRDYGRASGGGNGGVWTGGRRRSGGIGDIIGIILGGGNISIGGGGGSAGSSAGEYARGKQYLETLARNSGGRNFEADTTYNLDAAFSGIAEELRRQYSLGYYPQNPGTPGER
ncbi:MAG: VWA domain-containing protein, partial [Pyrinomonadaceae bacterium]|nr:VWA domain-containing protein [Pyrinomonadaceae bacterium]